MIKLSLWAALVGCCLAYPVTQEELAQYVARQQTAGLGAHTARRQAYVLQPQSQPKSIYQGKPAEQIYQVQPKQAQQIYQVPATKQYYQPQQAVEPQQQYYQYQPQQYQAQPAKKLVRPVAGQQPAEQEDYDHNPQYQFGFDIKDDEFTNYQKRKEQREGDKISGSYSVVDSDGYIRTVTYTADPLEGFKADVVREPTDIKVKIPQPQQQYQQEQYPQQYQNIVARKQQTQQYLQASAPLQKQQIVVRPEHTQVYAASPAQYQKQISAYSGAQPAGVKYAQQPQLYQAYQQ